MAKKHDAPVHWTVLPHGPIQQLEDNLWTVEGSLPVDVPMRRRMNVVRLAGDKLLLHSAMALDDATMSQIEALGEPAVMVVPNRWHRLDVAAYKQRYKRLRVYCPVAARDFVRECVPVDGHYDALPADTCLRVEPLAGLRTGEAAFVVKSAKGRSTLILNDVVCNIAHPPGLKGWGLRVLGYTGGLKIPIAVRLRMIRDPAALAHHLRQLALEPGLVRILVSHGDPVEHGAGAVLDSAAWKLDH